MGCDDTDSCCKTVLLMSKDIEILKEEFEKVVEINKDQLISTTKVLTKLDKTVDRLSLIMESHTNLLSNGTKEIRGISDRMLILETRGNKPAVVSSSLTAGSILAAWEALKTVLGI